MAFEEVKAGEKKKTFYIKPKDMTVGKSITGRFHNSFTNQTKFGESTTHIISVDPFTKDGEEYEAIGINGTGHLNYLMEQVEKGDLIRITYLGKESVENIIQPVHKFKLEIDKDAPETVEEDDLPI